MPQLPGGTVTLLFTDVEGSTSLLRRLGSRYAGALEDHRRLLRAAFAARGGREVDTQGDAFFVVFPRALDAAAAAVDAQRALASHNWPAGGAVSVRMGLHTGEPTLAGHGYVGLAVHRAARLCAAGHGGQILVSESTSDLIREAAPDGDGYRLRDLGKFHLKDLPRPERIFQVVEPGLRADFPPLRTLDARSSSLPVQRTPLIGRERELEDARRRVLDRDVRLLTLTGPGGTGKTRLALHLAAELTDCFEDGAYLVALAPVADPALVPSTLAQTLGLQPDSSQPLPESLEDHLRDKCLLLLFDNFEQVMAAAPFVGRLLEVGRGLKVLVTSRSALHVYGEHELPVPPLAVPDPRRLPPIEALIEYPAVALFVQRARAVRPDFSITPENARAVTEVCGHLDGLPLGIELVAARARHFTPQAILARLTAASGEAHLRLLAGGASDLPPRHQTIRATVDWSHNLLDDSERAIFRRLAIFVGGCTLEAAEAVCAPKSEVRAGGLDLVNELHISNLKFPTVDILDGLTSLADKSLLRQEEGADGEPRFLMLETIRQYAIEQLEAYPDEAIKVRERHAEYFLALAEEAEPALRGSERDEWLDRLEREHDNLRAALAWSQAEPGRAEVALRLAAALPWFWYLHCHVAEGRGWLESALAAGSALPTPLQAKALSGAGILARLEGDFGLATTLLERSRALFGALGDSWGTAWSIGNLGLVALYQGDHERATTLGQQSLELFQNGAETWGSAMALGCLGMAAYARGDLEQAAFQLTQSQELFRQQCDPRIAARVLALLGNVVHARGDGEYGARLLAESLALNRDLSDTWTIAFALGGLGLVAHDHGDDRLAAQLFGTAAALREAIRAPLFPAERAHLEPVRIAARAALGGELFTAAWTEGWTMSPERAVAHALGLLAPD